MKKVVLLFLFAFATSAWAQNNQDQTNIYDAFRQWLKPPAGASVDEQVTAIIKRHMANLLYPVDMSSFRTPEKDSNFRDLIKLLQKQMGVPDTGILTSDQFDRLAEASRDIDASAIGLSGKIVFMTEDGKTVSAVGTGVMDDIAHPVNVTRILCLRTDSTCEMSSAEFDLKVRMLHFGSPVYYDVKTWAPGRVTAIREHPCGTASMTIDVKTKAVTITSVPHKDLSFCTTEAPSIWTLADGFGVGWNIARDKRNKALALVYEPSKKLVPLLEPLRASP